MNRKSTRYFSRLQELQVAQLVKGKPTPNSGATPYRKGDVTVSGLDSWLIECKTTTTPKQSFSIKKIWLEDIKEQAKQQGKLNHALAFNYGPNQRNYYILDEDTFKGLFDEDNT